MQEKIIYHLWIKFIQQVRRTPLEDCNDLTFSNRSITNAWEFRHSLQMSANIDGSEKSNKSDTHSVRVGVLTNQYHIQYRTLLDCVLAGHSVNTEKCDVIITVIVRIRRVNRIATSFGIRLLDSGEIARRSYYQNPDKFITLKVFCFKHGRLKQVSYWLFFKRGRLKQVRMNKQESLFYQNS